MKQTVNHDTRELVIKMEANIENINKSILELKESFKEEIGAIKENMKTYVTRDSLERRIVPVEKFVNAFYGVMVLIVLGITGLLLSHVIPGFKLGG